MQVQESNISFSLNRFFENSDIEFPYANVIPLFLMALKQRFRVLATPVPTRTKKKRFYVPDCVLYIFLSLHDLR